MRECDCLSSKEAEVRHTENGHLGNEHDVRVSCGLSGPSRADLRRRGPVNPKLNVKSPSWLSGVHDTIRALCLPPVNATN